MFPCPEDLCALAVSVSASPVGTVWQLRSPPEVGASGSLGDFRASWAQAAIPELPPSLPLPPLHCVLTGLTFNGDPSKARRP